MIPCEYCGEPVSPELRGRNRREHSFCCHQCRINYHNAKAREKRRQLWLEAPLKTCVECGEKFRPEFLAGWHYRKRCPGCRLSASEAQRRYKAKIQAERKADQAERVLRPIRRCRSKEMRGFRSPFCTGWIRTGGNWWFCSDCDREYTSRPSCAADTEYSVQTIDLGTMGVMR